MSHGSVTVNREERGLFDRLLSPFSLVQSGEGVSAVLLAANVFLLLAGYYVLKTVREPLILQQGGAEVKSYSAAGQAVLFLLVVPVFGMLASRVSRVTLVGGVTSFFIMNLVIFAALGAAGVRIGVAYYLWLGIFNMLSVAQFWGFANDLYTEEQGKRLFPIVGVGASLGAWVGSKFAGEVYRALGPYRLMLISACVLTVCVLLTVIVHRRERDRASGDRKKEASQPVEDKKGGFALIFRNRYLGLIAALVLLLNMVNTLGGYMLDTFVVRSAAALPEAERDAFIGEFFGNYYFSFNLLGFLIQAFLVSRLLKWIGVRGALFILPLIALGGYSGIAIVPILMVVQLTKIMENATDYSLNNTVRHALYLPTPREAKYKAKAATDTFFVRFGDMLQAGIVYVGATMLSLSIQQFAMINVALAAVWVGIAVMLYRQHKQLASEA